MSARLTATLVAPLAPDAAFSRAADSSGRRIRQRDRAQIERLTAYLESHVGEPLRLPDMERMTGLGTAKLKYVFKAVTGMTVREYQNHLKEQKIRRLLSETELSVAQISERMGFSDPSGLTRFFVNHAGVSPTEYRKAHRNTD